MLYAGALRAVDKRGFWFHAVAGASAGAITATLIAAGLTVEEMENAVPAALKRIRKNWLADITGQPFIRTEGLRKWIDQILAERVSPGGISLDGPVTFGQLYELTKIELYVVAVDVASRQPIVFSAHTTPQLSVSRAVMASSAIPFAFRPGRLKFTNGEVHRLMDGGMWANYPAFVFKDASFRVVHELPTLPVTSTTVGFTLEVGPTVQPAQPDVFVDGWTEANRDKGASLRGYLRNPIFRLYFLTVVPIILAIQSIYTIKNFGLLFLQDPSGRYRLNGIAGQVSAWFNGFFTHFYPAFWSVALVIGLIALVLAFIGATALDSGKPVLSTLMAVGTNVPYWFGYAPGDNLIRLSVPDGIDTMSFKLKPEVIQKAIADAEIEADKQLETVLT